MKHQRRTWETQETKERPVSYTCVKNIQWFAKPSPAWKGLRSASVQNCRLSCSHYIFIVGLGIPCPLHCDYLLHVLCSVSDHATHSLMKSNKFF